MAKVSVYLNFASQTEEAFNFYKSVFGTDFDHGIMRFGDVPASPGMPPLPRYYKTKIYTDDQRQLLWLYAEDKGIKWVKGFEVIGANTVNKDYYERLLKEKNENGIGLHEDSIEEIERKKAINRMNKLQNLTSRKKAQRRQIKREEEDIMYQYLSAEYCPF